MDYITESKSYFFGLIRSESKVPAPESTKSSMVISQLAKEFADRSRADIKKWRQAIQAAENPENPRWALLQDLYDNLMNDGHLMACIQIRKAATLSNRFYIRDASGENQDDKTALLTTEWFYHMMENLLDTTYRGYSVIELVDPNFMQWELWPRRNIVPQTHRINFEAFGDKGIVYIDTQYLKNVIEHRNQNLLGILNDIVPQLIWKRNAQQTWADFSERFGIPLITAKTNKTDKKSLDAIQKGIDNLGQALNAMLPEGTTIEIHDTATKGDPHKIFLEQIGTCNSEVSKRILGGTMITDNGSSKSQSEVHERTLDQKISESDRRSIEFFVNGKLIPILRANGMNFADGDVFVFDRTEQLGIKDHWEIVKDALDKYEIDDKWVSNRFNFPITGKKKETSGKLPPSQKARFSANFQ